jgi:hypothetical protein
MASLPIWFSQWWQSLQPSEMPDPWCSAVRFQNAKNRSDLGLVNNVDGENVQTLHLRFRRWSSNHYVHGIGQVDTKLSPWMFRPNSHLFTRKINYNIIDDIFLGELLTRGWCIQYNQTPTAEDNHQYTFRDIYFAFLSYSRFISARCKHMIRWISVKTVTHHQLQDDAIHPVRQYRRMAI